MTAEEIYLLDKILKQVHNKSYDNAFKVKVTQLSLHFKPEKFTFDILGKFEIPFEQTIKF